MTGRARTFSNDWNFARRVFQWLEKWYETSADMMYLLFIALGGLGGGLLFIALVTFVFPVHLTDAAGFGGFFLSCFVGCWLVRLVVGRPAGGYLPSTPPVDYEKEGLLTAEMFNARRAFEVEEFEDEGLHFFLELEDGRVLFLCGQYLYDYQEITDDPDFNQPARFPCTSFTVKRHKTELWVHSIECAGPYLKPEAKFPHYSKAYQRAHGFPCDGDLLDVPYEEVRARFEGASS